MTPEGRAQLERHEGGHRLKMYPDSKGIPTIGVGHNLRDRPISRRASDVIFEDDIADDERDLARALPWVFDLDPVRRDTFVNLVHNMGIGNAMHGLLSFTKMLAAAQRGDWQTAHDELLDSNYPRDVGPQRSADCANQLLTGEWA